MDQANLGPHSFSRELLNLLPQLLPPPMFTMNAVDLALKVVDLHRLPSPLACRTMLRLSIHVVKVRQPIQARL
jgi:hypothetical protein